MTIVPGTHIGPYEIQSHAGAGGMGEVWKACDTRLGRTVAIKISKQKFSGRFEREALAIAALNHPNIAALYDVGPDYLVMEYIEGEPIRGPLPLPRAIAYAKQILEALHAAHRAGIIHRDLKPSNILVKEKTIKVLDFGLAKRERALAVAADDSTEVISKAITAEGTIVGTLGYMAPEQLQNKDVDSRADIFAFGCVLYEMLIGERAFTGASSASVIAATIERTPPSVASIASASMDRVLQKCLAKDPEERWQSPLDIRIALDWIQPEPAPVHGSGVLRWLPWTIVVLTILGAVGLSAIHFGEKSSEIPIVRASIGPPEKAAFTFGVGSNPAISPDGHRIVFIARDASGAKQMWVRSLDSLSAYPLAGTTGAIGPFWSADGKFIVFAADGVIKTVDASGGPVVALPEAKTPNAVRWGAAWNREGTIIFTSPESTIQRVSGSGGAPTDLLTKDTAQGEGTLFYPSFLPDGQHFLYISEGRGHAFLSVGSLSSTEKKRIREVTLSPVVYSAGYVLFRQGTGLMAQRFDQKRLETTGEAVPVVERVGMYSASSNGILVYFPESEYQLFWVNRHGVRLSDIGDEIRLRGPIQLSPDAKHLIVEILEGANLDVWIYDLTRNLRVRFTFDRAADTNALWAPDGHTIVFSSIRHGHFDLYRKSADSAGTEQLLYADSFHKWPKSWSRDGNFLLFRRPSNAEQNLWILPDPLGLQGARKPFPFTQTTVDADVGDFSPDGHSVAYDSAESGRNEIYIAPFPGPGGKIQVSSAGGFVPRWRRDGKELFYIDPGSRMMAVAITKSGNILQVGSPVTLFSGAGTNISYPYDVAPDGQRFIIAAPAAPATTTLTLVQNWAAGLKK